MILIYYLKQNNITVYKVLKLNRKQTAENKRSK